MLYRMLIIDRYSYLYSYSSTSTRTRTRTHIIITVGSSKLCSGPKFRAAAPNIEADQNFSSGLNLIKPKLNKLTFLRVSWRPLCRLLTSSRHTGVRSLLVSYGDSNVWPGGLLQATVYMTRLGPVPYFPDMSGWTSGPIFSGEVRFFPDIDHGTSGGDFENYAEPTTGPQHTFFVVFNVILIITRQIWGIW